MYNTVTTDSLASSAIHIKGPVEHRKHLQALAQRLQILSAFRPLFLGLPLQVRRGSQWGRLVENSLGICIDAASETLSASICLLGSQDPDSPDVQAGRLCEHIPLFFRKIVC